MLSYYRLNIDSILIATIGSAVIGVAISYWDVYLYHIFLSISIVIFSIKTKQSIHESGIFKFQIKKIYHPLIVTFFWYSITIFWAPNLVYAFKYLFYLFCGFSLIVLITGYSTTLDRFKKLFHFLQYLFIVEMIIALLESFTAFKMPISRYSEIATFFGKTPQPVYQDDIIINFFNSSPPTGFHWDTNELSLAMVLIFPFFLCMEKTLPKSLGIISIIVLVVMSASRAVFFGIISTSFIYLFLIKKKIASLSLIWLSAISIMFGMLSFNNSDNPNVNEIANTIKTAYLYLTGDIDVDQSLKWRRELVSNGITALKRTGGIGVGAGGSVAIQEKLGGVDGRFTSMHNFWIEVLVEGGVIFFLLFISWFLKSVFQLFRISKSNKNKHIVYFSSSLFLSMIGFIPSAITSSSTVYFFPMWIMLGLVQSIIFLDNSK